MEKELLEKIQKRISEFENEFDVKLKIVQPVEQSQKVFAIQGNKVKIEGLHDKLLFLFEDIKIKHCNSSWHSFGEAEPKSIRYIYEY